jgi:hypothetical protein
MKDSRGFYRKLGFIGVGLCAACCILPIVGVVFGMGALTFLAVFLEWVGAILVIAAATFFGIYYFRNKKAPACDIDCSSREGHMK